MKVAVVGAGGFVGRAVVERLLAGALGSLTSLKLLDLRCPAVEGASAVIEGSYVDESVRNRLFEGGVDVLFHLATLAGGAAENDFALGRAANLDGTLALFDAAVKAGPAPIIVYTSSIAAIDMTVPRVDDAVPLRPVGSYGTHKAMAELYLADLTRRGELNGRAVRPSGVAARPAAAYAGFATWWMSDLFRAVYEDRSLDIPVAPDSVIWLQSIAQTADNIIHAATMSTETSPLSRSWTLPATVATIGELAASLEALTGRKAKFTYGETTMSLPPLDVPNAVAAGFDTDGDAQALCARVLEQLESEG